MLAVKGRTAFGLALSLILTLTGSLCFVAGCKGSQQRSVDWNGSGAYLTVTTSLDVCESDDLKSIRNIAVVFKCEELPLTAARSDFLHPEQPPRYRDKDWRPLSEVERKHLNMDCNELVSRSVSVITSSLPSARVDSHQDYIPWSLLSHTDAQMLPKAEKYAETRSRAVFDAVGSSLSDVTSRRPESEAVLVLHILWVKGTYLSSHAIGGHARGDQWVSYYPTSPIEDMDIAELMVKAELMSMSGALLLRCNYCIEAIQEYRWETGYGGAALLTFRPDVDGLMAHTVDEAQDKLGGVLQSRLSSR